MRWVRAVGLLAICVGLIWSGIPEVAGATVPVPAPYGVSCGISITGATPVANHTSDTSLWGWDLSCNWGGNFQGDEMQVKFQTTGYWFVVTVYNVTTCTGQCDFTYVAGTTPGNPCASFTDTGGYTATNPLCYGTLNNSSSPNPYPNELSGYVYDEDSGCTGGVMASCLVGVVTVSNAFGVAAPCNVVSESGFYPGVANGTSSYAFSFVYTGAVSEIVVDPVDGVSSVTINGQSFGSDSAVDRTPSSPATVNVKPKAGANMDNSEFWCYGGGTWVSWGTAYSDGSGQSPSGPGCSVLSTSGSGKSGNSWSLIVSLAGNANTGALVLEAGDGSTPTQTVLGKVFSADAAVTLKPSSTETLTVTQVAGSAAVPEFWCYSNTTSAWIDEGAIATGGSAGILTGAGGCFDLIKAFATSGMSLTNPVSWVTGLASDVAAVFEWVVIPCSGTWEHLANQFGITSNAPAVGSSSASQWLGNIGYLLTVGPSAGAAAIQSCASSGCSAPAVAAGMSVTVSGHVYSVDAPSAVAAVAATGSWSGILVSVLAAFLLVLFFIEIVRWVRRILGSGE